MSLSTNSFLFLFLPFALALFYFVHDRHKEYVVLFFSLLFYAMASLRCLLPFAGAVFVTILIGRLICRTNTEKKAIRKLLLITGLVFNIGMLAWYKYSDSFLYVFQKAGGTPFDTSRILVPVGISYFAFKAISYLVDNYRSNVSSGNPVVRDAVYLTFFGQVLSGPLSRYSDMKLFPTPTGSKAERIDFFTAGFWRFVMGFCKKILIANLLGNLVTEIYGTAMGSLTTSYLWLGAVCSLFQVCYDFTGYSDMAIGVSQMFGYRCPENFDYPYTTESVSQFWRKWHITLGFWFRDYVYIPLGGSRCSVLRNIFNLLVVWTLTGIWHGASWNYMIFALVYCFFIILEKYLRIPGRFKWKWAKALYRVFTLLVICLQNVIFLNPNLPRVWKYFQKMFVYCGNYMTATRTKILFREYLFIILVAAIFCMPVNRWLAERLKISPRALSYCRIVDKILLAVAFVYAVAFIAAWKNNPFVYANF